MAKEVIESFCKDCGFAILVGWPHKCVRNKEKESTKPQKENQGGFLTVGRPRVR